MEFAGEVLQLIRRHARSSMQAEICGVLIGTAAAGVTHVKARIPGEGAAQGGAHVTFTQDTWEHIFKVKDAEYPTESIVGWYHSHPGFGIFLSEYDLFIHENFFNAPHQVAWVFDPHSDEEGCFGWIGKKVEPLDQIAVQRKHRPPTEEQAAEEAAGHKASGTVESAASAKQEKADAAVRTPSRVRSIVFCSVVAFSIGFVLSHYTRKWQRAVWHLIGPTPSRAEPSVAKRPSPSAKSGDPGGMTTIVVSAPLDAPVTPPAATPPPASPEKVTPLASPADGGSAAAPASGTTVPPVDPPAVPAAPISTSKPEPPAPKESSPPNSPG